MNKLKNIMQFCTLSPSICSLSERTAYAQHTHSIIGHLCGTIIFIIIIVINNIINNIHMII